MAGDLFSFSALVTRERNGNSPSRRKKTLTLEKQQYPHRAKWPQHRSKLVTGWGIPIFSRKKRKPTLVLDWVLWLSQWMQSSFWDFNLFARVILDDRAYDNYLSYSRFNYAQGGTQDLSRGSICASYWQCPNPAQWSPAMSLCRESPDHINELCPYPYCPGGPECSRPQDSP